MFEKLYSLFLSNNPHKKWFRFLMMIAIILLILLTYKQITKRASIFNEGFSQDTPFLMKREEKVYDIFYSQVYDLIMEPQKSGDFVFNYVMKSSKSSKRSLFLDAGCGTGYLVNKLKENGYDAIGIDKSYPMIEYAQNKYVDINLIHGDFEDPMMFDKRIFTHILCTQSTIYFIKDKVSFFRNCFYWLMPGGFIAVHLVDKETFDPIVSVGKPSILNIDESPQKYADTRITTTEVDFIDFKYKSQYQFSEDDATVVFTEKFTDASSMNVRQNEQTMYMNQINDIIKDIQYCGFIEYDKIDMQKLNGDANQFLYLFQKPF